MTGKSWSLIRCMRTARVLAGCVIILLTLAVCAQNGAYSITGSVVNSVTGEPISRALVQAGGAGSAVLTDSEGHFEIDGVTNTRAMVRAHKPGFFAEGEASQGVSYGTRVTVGPNAPAVTIKLVPEAVIFGHVTSNGEAVENIPVKLLRMHVVGGWRTWEVSGNATSDADGEFRIANLVPGMYLAAFGPASDGSIQSDASRSRGRGYTEVFFPASPDLATAASIELSGGQQFEADVSVKSEPLYRVSGMISAFNPKWPTTVLLVTSARETLPISFELNEKTGEFRADVAAGSYTLRAEQYAQDAPLQANVPITVNGDLGGIRLALQPSATIPVNVRTEVSDAHLKAIAQIGAAVTVRLSSSGPAFSAPDFISTQVPAGENALVIRDVDPGKYYADISPQGPYYVQSAECGGVDLLREDLSVAAGSRVPPIEVIVRDNGATVTGTVNNGSSERGTVILVPDGNARQTKIVAEQGSFTFNDVPPGDYSVFAVENGFSLEYTNPEIVAPFLAKAARISAQANGSVSVPPLELITTDAAHAAQ